MSFAVAMSLIITSDRKKYNEGDKEKLLTPTIPWETGAQSILQWTLLGMQFPCLRA